MATATTTMKQRKPLRPISGTARWIRPLTLPHGFGRLSITTTDAGGKVNAVEFDCEAILDGDGVTVLGVRLVKENDDAYHVGRDGSCDCADATFSPNRPGGCRHARAVRVALQQLGQRL